MSEKKKIVLSGYYGFENLGDEAILNYLVEFLKQNDVEPFVLSANPKRTELVHGVKSVKRTDLQSVKRVMQESDGLISGGGSLLQDKTSKKSLLYYLLIMLLAKVYRKPFYFYGQGVGPIAAKTMKWSTNLILNLATSISVRDSSSKELLQNDIKLQKKDISVIHDPVLFYPKSDENNFLLTESEQSFLDKKPVFLSLRPSEGDGVVVEQIRKYLTHLSEKNIPVISFGLHPTQDNDFTKRIMDDFDNCLFIERMIDLNTASYIFRKSSVVVGMRLHSLILAASQHTPFIGISYDPKIDAFMRKFHLVPVGNIHNLNHETLFEKTLNNIQNEKQIRSELHVQIEQMKKTNDAFNQKLLRVLKG